MAHVGVMLHISAGDTAAPAITEGMGVVQWAGSTAVRV
jgi:hypothetical protein